MDDGGSPITHYILETREPGSRDWNTIAELPKSADHFVVKDLVEGEEYDFRITAENKVGRSKPVEADATVKPERKPEVPSSPVWPLTASDVTKDSVLLSWKPPTDDGGSALTGYIIDKLDLEYGGWVRAAHVQPQTTSYNVPGLVKNHRYNFRVYSENKCGVSEPVELSEPVKASTGIG